MLYDLSRIREIRRKFGLTQSQFAKRANVSQSMIAKIEAGRLDPSYSKAKQIFNALDQLTNKRELKAKDIMHHEIISTAPTEPIKRVIKRMNKYAISQMPVLDNKTPIGMISENIILNNINKLAANPNLVVKEIMQDAPPSVSGETPVSVIANLLKYFSMVIIINKGSIKGLITKADVLKGM